MNKDSTTVDPRSASDRLQLGRPHRTPLQIRVGAVVFHRVLGMCRIKSIGEKTVRLVRLKGGVQN